MNDILYLNLDFDPRDEEQLEKVESLLPRVDDILKEHGWEYSGFRNMYRPVKGTDSDETFYAAMEAVQSAEWMKEYNPHFGIGTHTNVCEFDEIVTSAEEHIPFGKIKRYIDYHAKTGKYAHGIVVDENHVLRDGYITYLLAKETTDRPDIMLVRSGQQFKKAVSGKIAILNEDGAAEETEEYGIWYCDIPEAVVPEDVLEVETENGNRLVRAKNIFYLAGAEDCHRYRNVIGIRKDVMSNDMGEMRVVPKEMFTPIKELAVSVTDGYLAFNSKVVKQSKDVSADEITFDAASKTILFLPA